MCPFPSAPHVINQFDSGSFRSFDSVRIWGFSRQVYLYPSSLTEMLGVVYCTKKDHFLVTPSCFPAQRIHFVIYSGCGCIPRDGKGIPFSKINIASTMTTTWSSMKYQFSMSLLSLLFLLLKPRIQIYSDAQLPADTSMLSQFDLGLWLTLVLGGRLRVS